MKWEKNIVLFSAIFVFNVIKATAQYIAPDSLQKIITATTKETERIDAMNWLSFRFCQNYEMDSSQFWVNKAYALSKQINYKKGLGFANINFGNLESHLYNQYGAIDLYQKSIAAFEESGNKGLMGMAYNYIGRMYHIRERYPESLENIYKGLKLATEAGYIFGQAHSHLLLGQHYSESADVSPAYPHLKIAINLYKELGENDFLALCYWNRGMAGLSEQKYQQSIIDFEASRTAIKGLKSAFWYEVDYYRALGLMHTSKGDSCKAVKKFNQANEQYKLAEKYLLEALKINPAFDIYEAALLKNSIGLLYLAAGKYESAKKKLKESVSLTDSARDKRLLESNYFNLARLDSFQGNFESAYINMRKFNRYHDNLYNEENVRKIEGFKAEFELEKSKAQLRILTAENDLKTTIVSKQKQQQNFALAGIGVLLLAGVYWFQRYRGKRKRQSQQEVANERFRISSELHDEVGATLSGIAMYSHLAKEQIKNPKAGEIENSLTIIQSNAGEMVNKLNDIVWLINPGQDSLQQLMQRLEDYAIQIAAVKNIRVKSNVNGHHSQNILPAETRRNIYLLFKEAINNAVKYSNATLLELYMKEQDGTIEISLKDDGDGFEIGKVNRGNGLNNMEQRSKDMKANCKIESGKAKGTSITVTIQIP